MKDSIAPFLETEPVEGEPVAWRFKPLEWVVRPIIGGEDRIMTKDGRYWLSRVRDGFMVIGSDEQDRVQRLGPEVYTSKEAAQAVVQADHERRTSQYLEPASVPQAQPPEVSELVARLNATYAAWNNPPSDGLPDGAGVILEAAALLSSTSERLKAVEAERGEVVIDFINQNKRLDDELDEKHAWEERATRAEAALAGKVEAIRGLLQNWPAAWHPTPEQRQALAAARASLTQGAAE